MTRTVLVYPLPARQPVTTTTNDPAGRIFCWWPTCSSRNVTSSSEVLKTDYFKHVSTPPNLCSPINLTNTILAAIFNYMHYKLLTQAGLKQLPTLLKTVFCPQNSLISCPQNCDWVGYVPGLLPLPQSRLCWFSLAHLWRFHFIFFVISGKATGRGLGIIPHIFLHRNSCDFKMSSRRTFVMPAQ